MWADSSCSREFIGRTRTTTWEREARQKEEILLAPVGRNARTNRQMAARRAEEGRRTLEARPRARLPAPPDAHLYGVVVGLARIAVVVFVR